MRRRSPHGAGLTLPEVLVVLAIAGVLLTAVAGMLSGGRRHGAAMEERVEAAATLRLAAELLREELRLAGAVPWPPPASLPEVPALAGWLATPIAITPAPGGHQLAVRFVDHRLEGGLVARDLAFEAGADARAEPQLYRRAAGSARQPLVGGVDRLAVIGVIDATGKHIAAEAAGGQRIAALVLELGMGDRVTTVVVELPSKPLARVGSVP